MNKDSDVNLETLSKSNRKKFNSAEFLKGVSDQPGVYVMFDENNDYLYVGKARNLKRRLLSYFREESTLAPKTRVMVSKIHHIELTETATESEALLLESNLIKSQKPRYNVLLRDSKSYPYILIDTTHEFPRVDLYRGKKQKGLLYFGPYPNSYAVKKTLSLLQKLFLIRQCENSYYAHRSRPCLQYQIKRCTAPCVGYVSKTNYDEQINWAKLFLSGKSHDLLDLLSEKMHLAAENLEFEKAGEYRDVINSLRHTMQKQNIEEGDHNIDVFGFAFSENKAALCVTFIRAGGIVGDKRFIIDNSMHENYLEVAERSVVQFYHDKPAPSELIIFNENYFQHLDNDGAEVTSIASSLSILLSEQSSASISVKYNVRGVREKWQALAQQSANLHLQQAEADLHRYSQEFGRLKSIFNLEKIPQKLACIDISHMMGKQTYASFVVWNHKGAVKREYRSLKINDIEPGDDYAAINQAVARVLPHMINNHKNLPDVLFIDGGKGQLESAIKAFEEIREEYPQINNIRLMSIAKGVARKAGDEQFIMPRASKDVDYDVLQMKKDDSALHLIQQVRDESHRFAITKHRKARGKIQLSSIIDEIPGVGGQRKQVLLDYFGGLQGIMKASIVELEQVNGISPRLAKTIYHFLR